jgi:hypothetical protein
VPKILEFQHFNIIVRENMERKRFAKDLEKIIQSLTLGILDHFRHFRHL